MTPKEKLEYGEVIGKVPVSELVNMVRTYTGWKDSFFVNDLTRLITNELNRRLRAAKKGVC